jgi:hypothetical protein
VAWALLRCIGCLLRAPSAFKRHAVCVCVCMCVTAREVLWHTGCQSHGTDVLGKFAELRKGTISFVMSARPSAWNKVACHWADLRLSQKSVEKILFH